MPKNESTATTYFIKGHIDFINVIALRRQVEDFIKQSEATALLDFSEVEQCKSVVLSLLVSWVRYAKQQQKQVIFSNLTEHIRQLIQLSHLEPILAPYVE